jgi:hypothetical protein
MALRIGDCEPDRCGVNRQCLGMAEVKENVKCLGQRKSTRRPRERVVRQDPIAYLLIFASISVVQSWLSTIDPALESSTRADIGVSSQSVEQITAILNTNDDVFKFPGSSTL